MMPDLGVVAGDVDGLGAWRLDGGELRAEVDVALGRNVSSATILPPISVNFRVKTSVRPIE